MLRLLIIGDSWGCGEWAICSENNIKVVHPGLTEYLSSKYLVTNLSRSGASNWQTAFSLNNYLAFRVDRETIPIVFVIQSDASRPLMSDKFDVDFDVDLVQCTTLLEFYKIALEKFYIKLNYIAINYGIKIHMIGGLTDLDLELLSLYNNLIPCCESWIKLLDAKHTISQIPLMLDSRLLTRAKRLNKLNLVNEIIDYSDQHFLSAQKLMETEFFGPAYGDFHPNRKSHEILTNHITTYLENTK